METRDVVVVGGGPAGLVAALAIAARGTTVTLARKRAPADTRTTALLSGSMDLLDRLGVTPALEAETAPLATMRIVDDTGGLFRAPTVTFEASELGLEMFGRNVRNEALVAVLERAVMAEPAIATQEAWLTGARIEDDHVALAFDDGSALDARLVVAADGRESRLREAAGIATTTRAYDQVAVTLNLAHTVAHRNTSTEFHTRSGPFTLVPLPGQMSSLVAVVTPHEAKRLVALDDAELGREVERRSRSILGKTTPVGARGAWPLSSLVPERHGARRVVLVGESGHVIPPIGAQGLNLGFRDAETIADLVAEAMVDGADVGSERVTGAYDRRRRADVRSRATLVDLVNRSLLSELLPLHALRAAGLTVAGLPGPLRRMIMREGLSPSLFGRA